MHLLPGVGLEGALSGEETEAWPPSFYIHHGRRGTRTRKPSDSAGCVNG